MSSGDGKFTIGALDTGIVIHSEEEFASLIADFVREALGVVGVEFPEATVAVKWRKFVVFVAVSCPDDGDLRDEPGHGHPTLEP